VLLTKIVDIALHLDFENSGKLARTLYQLPALFRAGTL
jgi:hypothetical protein